MLSALNSRKLTNSDLMFSIYLSHPPPLPVFHIKQSRDKRLLTHRSQFNIPGLVSWRLFRSFPHGHKMAAQFQASCLFSKKNGIKKEAGATGFICSFIRRAKTSPKLFPQLLFVFYWPKLCHQATPGQKGVWKRRYLTLLDSVVEGSKEEQSWECGPKKRGGGGGSTIKLTSPVT